MADSGQGSFKISLAILPEPVYNEYLIGIIFESKDNRQECLNHINKITRLKAFKMDLKKNLGSMNLYLYEFFMHYKNCYELVKYKAWIVDN